MTASPSPRIAVFVSSTLGECASERAAARRAIESLNYEAVLFETTGARPHPARATYLSGLARSQICVIIWKESYGYVDPELGISGIEDEYRQALKNGQEILLYIKRTAPQRDKRLEALLDEARSPLTYSPYETETELEEQIRADITSVVSQVFTEHFAAHAARLTDASAVLGGILPAGSPVIRRPHLEAKLAEAISGHRVTWVVGQPGSGKTVLLAQWAKERRAAYVNARGLSLLRLLRLILKALSPGTEVPGDFVSVEEGTALLRDAWRNARESLLVIDDPAEPGELAALIGDLVSQNTDVRVVIATRTERAPSSEFAITVPGLTPDELRELAVQLSGAARATVTTLAAQSGEVLPIEVRRNIAGGATSPQLAFDEVPGVSADPRTRELLAFIARSPEPLSLEALLRLQSGNGQTAVEIEGQLASISSMIVDDGVGYRPVHDELAAELRDSLSRRPALHKFVSLRLGQYFTKAKRFSASFHVYRDVDVAKALTAGRRAASQLAVEGAFAGSIEPLEFIANSQRREGQRLDLVMTLLSLAQAREVTGDTAAATKCHAKAAELAKTIDDAALMQVVADQQLIARVRHDLRPEDLASLREIRKRYLAEGRLDEAARLAVEEGAILIHVSDYEQALPVLREAHAAFIKTGDRYGEYVATRNLISALNMIEGGQPEADQLLRDLNRSSSDTGRLRERAWICNILTRRYRIDGLLDESIAAAKEAIEIGRKLGDAHLATLNQIGLGNALVDKGDLASALEIFKQCGRDAQTLKRRETEGLASRRAADVLVSMAQDAVPIEKAKLYGEAENFATFAVGLLRDSIAQSQVAEALEARGDAREGLGRIDDARADYAQAARLFSELKDDGAVRLIRHLAINTDVNRPKESIETLMAALPPSPCPPPTGPWELLVRFVERAATEAPRRAVGPLFGVALRIAQTIVSPALEVGLWLRLLALAIKREKLPDDGRGSFILSAFLAHSRQRELSNTQLIALADQSIGGSKYVQFRQTPSGHLQISLHLGSENRVLLVLDDVEGTPATRFVTLSLASFFLGFREEITRDFMSGEIPGGTCVRIGVVDIEHVPEAVRPQLQEAAAQSPIAVAYFSADERRRPGDLIVACKADAQLQCRGDPMKVSDLQLMYADALRAVLNVALGGDIEDEVLRPKLVALLRSTVY